MQPVKSDPSIALLQQYTSELGRLDVELRNCTDAAQIARTQQQMKNVARCIASAATIFFKAIPNPTTSPVVPRSPVLVRSPVVSATMPSNAFKGIQTAASADTSAAAKEKDSKLDAEAELLAKTYGSYHWIEENIGAELKSIAKSKFPIAETDVAKHVSRHLMPIALRCSHAVLSTLGSAFHKGQTSAWIGFHFVVPEWYREQILPVLFKKCFQVTAAAPYIGAKTWRFTWQKDNAILKQWTTAGAGMCLEVSGKVRSEDSSKAVQIKEMDISILAKHL